MTYDEIMAITDLELREQELIKFYTEEIKILDWLKQEDGIQKIRFKDRWEYKKNSKLHRLDGPAIDFDRGGGGYFIEGKKMEFEDWKPVAKKLLREKKLERTLKED